jgi:hypothetical protein
MPDLIVFNLGEKGVNVDKNPLAMDDAELRKAQNVIRDPLGVEGGITNRPGLIKFNSVAANGTILGGVGVPLQNLVTGTRFLYIGRGTK